MPAWLLALPFVALASDPHSLNQANVHLVGSRTGGAGGGGGSGTSTFICQPGSRCDIHSDSIGGPGGSGGDVLGGGARGSFRVVNVEPWDVLNIRSGPSANDEIVSTIPPDGRGVRRVGNCQGNWCPIAYGRARGWVNGRFLTSE